MSFSFFTIGHSTRSLDEFAALLRVAGTQLVVDIRTVPRSRTNPQYNTDTLRDGLAAYRVAYERIAELGGLRGRAKTVSAEVNVLWENRSFHNYADYALSKSFRTGLDRLVALGREQPSAIMCSEAVWWRCHRRIVSDHLMARGETVFHLMGHDRVVPARLTEGARVQPSGVVVYPQRNVEHAASLPRTAIVGFSRSRG
ncbi:MAG: DNA repair protein [Candidatus Methylomirabilota bacterium]|nr:MAG: DNA repair protein [candidate division NC10 bacterium]